MEVLKNLSNYGLYIHLHAYAFTYTYINIISGEAHRLPELRAPVTENSLWYNVQ